MAKFKKWICFRPLTIFFVLLKKKIKEIPDDSRSYVTVGYCYALAGNVAEDHSCRKKSVEMLPVSLDSLHGPYLEHNLMKISILTGHYDLALDKKNFTALIFF